MRSGKLLDRVLSVFYTLVSADSNNQREKLMMEFSPMLASHESKITSNQKLFGRIEELFNQIDNLNLSKDFLEVTFNDGSYTNLTFVIILKEGGMLRRRFSKSRARRPPAL